MIPSTDAMDDAFGMGFADAQDAARRGDREPSLVGFARMGEEIIETVFCGDPEEDRAELARSYMDGVSDYWLRVHGRDVGKLSRP